MHGLKMCLSGQRKTAGEALVSPHTCSCESPPVAQRDVSARGNVSPAEATASRQLLAPVGCYPGGLELSATGVWRSLESEQGDGWSERLPMRPVLPACLSANTALTAGRRHEGNFQEGAAPPPELFSMRLRMGCGRAGSGRKVVCGAGVEQGGSMESWRVLQLSSRLAAFCVRRLHAGGRQLVDAPLGGRRRKLSGL